MKKACLVEYDGASYQGWQVQNGRGEVVPTVTLSVERALSKIYGGATVKVVGSGRTDSGVHAFGQCFDFTPPFHIESDGLVKGFNSIVEKSITMLEALDVSDEFHSRHYSTSKTYMYQLFVSPLRSSFLSHNAWHLRYPSFIGRSEGVQDELKSVLSLFLGEHDFSAYCVQKSLKADNVRTIYNIDVELDSSFMAIYGGFILRIYVRGNGFLHNMVRIIVGTAVGCVAGEVTIDDVKKSLTTGSKDYTGMTAPALGLHLYCVEYDGVTFSRMRQKF